MNQCKSKNLLATEFPELAKEWHPIKNGMLTPHDVTTGSNKKVWWIDEYGHEWQSQIFHRVKGSGCPYCAGKRVTTENSLATKRPDLAKEWHPTKNGELTPNDVSEGSNKKTWWRCSVRHEWEAKISNRAVGNGCPYCAGKLTTPQTSLQETHPELASEWHPTKNGSLTPNDVSHGSNKKVWWLSPEGYEWEAMVVRRARRKGCPVCVAKRK